MQKPTTKERDLIEEYSTRMRKALPEEVDPDDLLEAIALLLGRAWSKINGVGEWNVGSIMDKALAIIEEYDRLQGMPDWLFETPPPAP